MPFVGLKRIMVFDEDSTLKGVIVLYYENLYHEDYPMKPFLDGISYSSVVLWASLMHWSSKGTSPRSKCGAPSTFREIEGSMREVLWKKA